MTRAVWAVDASAFPSGRGVEEQARFLLRYAILAPSSHNAQPWQFAVDGDRVHVYADEDGWLPVADADRRELHVSLGCALENLVVAAAHFGFECGVAYRPDGDDGPVVTVTLDSSADAGSEGDPALFEAITERSTNHRTYEDRPVEPEALDRLRDAVAAHGVTFRLVDDEATKRDVAELVVRADREQFDDPDYRRELGDWIGNGALGASWLAAKVGQVAVTYLDLGARQGREDSALVRSAPVVGVLTTGVDDVESRLRAGRAFERLALAATDAGVAVHPMNQVLQVPALKAELSSVLDADEAALQLLFRLGYAEPEAGKSPRWPVEDVLVG